MSVLLVLLILEDVIGHYIPAVHFLDEFAAIGLFFFYLANVFFKGHVSRQDASIMALITMLLMIGFAGNHVSHVQPNVMLRIFDSFNIFKFAVSILGGQLVLQHDRDKELVIEYTACAVKCLVFFATVFMVINLFFDIGMHTDYRYGIRAYCFIYSRVGDFYSACVIWIIILTASLFYRNRWTTKMFIGLALIDMCASMRSRPVGFALLYVFAFYIFIIKKERKLRWWYVAAFAFMMYFVAADQLSFYFSGDRARKVLLKYGIITARNYFPLGSGFATYGTAVAQHHYSPLYRTYNFSSYWGLSPEYRAFLTDNFWPAVMAEMGFFGVILMAFLIYKTFAKLIRMTDNPYSKVCVYFGFGTLLLSSIIASSFFACTTLVVNMCVVSRLDGNRKTEPGGRKSYRNSLPPVVRCDENAEAFLDIEKADAGTKLNTSDLQLPNK